MRPRPDPPNRRVAGGRPSDRFQTRGGAADLVQEVIRTRRRRIGKQDQETAGITPDLTRQLGRRDARRVLADRREQRGPMDTIGAHRQDDDTRPRLDLLGADQDSCGAASGDEIGAEGLLDLREHAGEVGPMDGGDEDQTPVGPCGAAALERVPRRGARRRQRLGRA